MKLRNITPTAFEKKFDFTKVNRYQLNLQNITQNLELINEETGPAKYCTNH